MIDLYEALKITKTGNDDIAFLRNEGDSRYDVEVFTGKQIHNKYDLRKVKVLSIAPHFIMGEYEGMEFEIRK